MYLPYFRPYPYMSPPINKPTKTGHHMSTTPTINNYCYDYHYYNPYDIILLSMFLTNLRNYVFVFSSVQFTVDCSSTYHKTFTGMKDAFWTISKLRCKWLGY